VTVVKQHSYSKTVTPGGCNTDKNSGTNRIKSDGNSRVTTGDSGIETHANSIQLHPVTVVQ
jgi:hypothetical protein